MAAIVGLHGFHGIFHAGHFLNGGDAAAHDGADRGLVRIAAFEGDAFHEVAFAEHPANLLSIKYEDGSDVEIRHSPRHFGDGLMLFYAEKIAFLYEIPQTRNTHPPFQKTGGNISQTPAVLKFIMIRCRGDYGSSASRGVRHAAASRGLCR